MTPNTRLYLLDGDFFPVRWVAESVGCEKEAVVTLDAVNRVQTTNQRVLLGQRLVEEAEKVRTGI